MRQSETSTGGSFHFSSRFLIFAFPDTGGSFHFSFHFLIFAFPDAPESNTLSADSLAFILVYSFVLVALVIYVGVRLARRRWP